MVTCHNESGIIRWSTIVLIVGRFVAVVVTLCLCPSYLALAKALLFGRRRRHRVVVWVICHIWILLHDCFLGHFFSLDIGFVVIIVSWHYFALLSLRTHTCQVTAIMLNIRMVHEIKFVI
jgi:hypothetical protein